MYPNKEIRSKRLTAIDLELQKLTQDRYIIEQTIRRLETEKDILNKLDVIA